MATKTQKQEEKTYQLVTDDVEKCQFVKWGKKLRKMCPFLLSKLKIPKWHIIKKWYISHKCNWSNWNNYWNIEKWPDIDNKETLGELKHIF